jgi:cell division protein FtsQ
MTPGGELHVANRTELGRWRIPAIAFLVVMVLGSLGFAATRGPLFHADTIRVRGLEQLPRADVLRIAGISPTTNVFTLNAPAAERRLEALPWIADVTITKHLPTTVVVDIHEHVAVAITDSAGVPRLVAEDGSLLDVAGGLTVLPRIVAADDATDELPIQWVEGAARAVAAMDVALRSQIAQVSVMADGELQVDLRSGAAVAYGPAEELAAKAEALRAVLRWAARQGESVLSADVRVPATPSARFG